MSAVQQSNSTDATLTLPGPYKITTSSNGDMASISRSGTKSVSVKTSSLEGIKSVLSKFWPTGNEKIAPGATMVLMDTFSGDGARITLGSLLDLARVIDDLELIGATAPSPAASEEAPAKRRGRRPKAEQAEPSSTAPSQAAAPAPSAQTSETPQKRRGRPPKNASTASTETKTADAPKTARGRGKKAAPAAKAKAPEAKTNAKAAEQPSPQSSPQKRGRKPKAAVTTESAAPAKAPSRRGRAPKATTSSPLLSGAPSWFGGQFEPRYDGKTTSGGQFSLEKVPLKLEKPGSRHVMGVAQEPQDVMAWGYEIRSSGTHVAWVIVSGPSQLHIVSDDGTQAVPQASISDVMATISTRAPSRKAA